MVECLYDNYDSLTILKTIIINRCDTYYTTALNTKYFYFKIYYIRVVL